jgi:hypothetical protein
MMRNPLWLLILLTAVPALASEQCSDLLDTYLKEAGAGTSAAPTAEVKSHDLGSREFFRRAGEIRKQQNAIIRSKEADLRGRVAPNPGSVSIEDLRKKYSELRAKAGIGEITPEEFERQTDALRRQAMELEYRGPRRQREPDPREARHRAYELARATPEWKALEEERKRLDEAVGMSEVAWYRFHPDEGRPTPAFTRTVDYVKDGAWLVRAYIDGDAIVAVERNTPRDRYYEFLDITPNCRVASIRTSHTRNFVDAVTRKPVDSTMTSYEHVTASLCPSLPKYQAIADAINDADWRALRQKCRVKGGTFKGGIVCACPAGYKVAMIDLNDEDTTCGPKAGVNWKSNRDLLEELYDKHGAGVGYYPGKADYYRVRALCDKYRGQLATTREQVTLKVIEGDIIEGPLPAEKP